MPNLLASRRTANLIEKALGEIMAGPADAQAYAEGRKNLVKLHAVVAGRLRRGFPDRPIDAPRVCARLPAPARPAQVLLAVIERELAAVRRAPRRMEQKGRLAQESFQANGRRYNAERRQH